MYIYIYIDVQYLYNHHQNGVDNIYICIYIYIDVQYLYNHHQNGVDNIYIYNYSQYKGAINISGIVQPT